MSVAALLKASLALPLTSFPLRASPAREAAACAGLTTALYRRQATRLRSRTWTLTDGPPFANGALHVGHLLNKVLKDVLNRRALIEGATVRYAPGWDCHGLPIELRALAAAPAAGAPLDATATRALARTFANEAIATQAADFRRWGVLADWELAGRADRRNAYVTMDGGYEVAQLRMFAALVARGLVHRARRPVYWSPASRSALAEAELDYVDAHAATAAYVAFPLLDALGAAGAAARGALLAAGGGGGGGNGIAAVAWTTTPWTLPANVALAVHPELEYAVVEVEMGEGAERALLVQVDRLADLERALRGGGGSDSSAAPPRLRVRARFPGAELVGSLFAHPLAASLPSEPALAASCGTRAARVIAAAHVTADAGTGIVHTAPGHGHDDYVACAAAAAHGASPPLPTLCPVDDSGAFTAEAGAALAGLAVLGAGGAAVLAALRDAGALLAEERIRHRYPYDWRSRTPVIVRATPQWFVHVGGEAGLAAEARAALAGVAMTPLASRRRLEAALGTRTEWCISRQRVWGVPVPALFVSRDGGGGSHSDGIDGARRAVLTPEVVRHIADVFEREGGSDCWWTRPAADFVPPALAAAHPAGTIFEKGGDTLDVWLDSGSAWAAAAAPLGASGSGGGGGGAPADAVIEGSDQHRGWFQSMLLTSVAATGAAPYREVITHGFVLDEQGRKMSKSLGNVLAPAELIDGGGRGGGGTSAAPRRSTRRGATAGAAAAAAAAAAPDASAPGLGADVLRYWAASADYTRDAVIGPAVLSTVSEAVRRVRNTLRFLLGNVHDFAPRTVPVAPGEMTLAGSGAASTGAGTDAEVVLRAWAAASPMPPSLPREREEAPPGWGSCGFDGSGLDLLATAPEAASPPPPLAATLGVVDRCFLHRLAVYADACDAAYARRDFAAVAAASNAFISTDLSAHYIDLIKDRLYVAGGARRVQAQALLWAALQQLARALAPILPFTVDEAFQHSAAPLLLLHRGGAAGGARAATLDDDASLASGASVFDVDWRRAGAESLRGWRSEAVAARWAALLQLRGDAHRALEALRVAKLAGGALDVALRLYVPPRGAIAALLEELRAGGELEDVFLTSAVEVAALAEEEEEAAASSSSSSGGGGGGDGGGVRLETGADAGGHFRALVDSRVALAAARGERVLVELIRAPGAKCRRCWKVKPEAATHTHGVCARCDDVLAAAGIILPKEA